MDIEEIDDGKITGFIKRALSKSTWSGEVKKLNDTEKNSLVHAVGSAFGAKKYVCVWNEADPSDLKWTFDNITPDTCAVKKCDGDKCDKVVTAEGVMAVGDFWLREIPEDDAVKLGYMKRRLTVGERDLLSVFRDGEDVAKYAEENGIDSEYIPQMHEITPEEFEAKFAGGKYSLYSKSDYERYKKEFGKMLKYDGFDWVGFVNGGPRAKKAAGSASCPKGCETVHLYHGTSRKRAESILKNGFFKVTDKPTSDLAKGEIGRDMRENMGGIGEQGLIFFARDDSSGVKAHAHRVAQMDKDEPAVLEGDFCVCKFVKGEMTDQLGFSEAVKGFAQSKYKSGDKRYFRDYGIEPTSGGLHLFQRFANEKLPIGEVLDEMNVDAVEDGSYVVALPDPNRSVVKGSLNVKKVE